MIPSDLPEIDPHHDITIQEKEAKEGADQLLELLRLKHPEKDAPGVQDVQFKKPKPKNISSVSTAKH